MKLVYTNENTLLIGNVQNILNNAGIHTCLKNEYAGGASGDLSFLNTWQELWIVNDEDYERATDLINQSSHKDTNDWLCTKCGENNSSAFDFCWNCESENTYTA